MSFTYSQSLLQTATFMQSAIAKTLSLIENLDFSPAFGPIEARQFFKIQARARSEPDLTRKARTRLTTLTHKTVLHDETRIKSDGYEASGSC